MTKKTINKQNDQLTNWYMINLCWGVAGLLGLFLIYQGYRNTDFILAMQPITWVLTAVFAVGGLALFVLGKTKSSKRMTHYAIFSGVCTLVALWLALYNRIRPMLESLLRAILQNSNLIVSSYWNVWIPMIGIGIYLIASFIFFVIKVTKK